MLIKMLLTTVIQGGLGNQLFEVFSLLNLVKKYGYDYIIEKKDTSHSITPRYT